MVFLPENNFFKKLKNYFNLSVILFLIFNTLKIVFFNIFIYPDNKNYDYFFFIKILVSFVLVSFVYLSLLKFELRKTCVFVYFIQLVYLFSHMCYFKYIGNYLHITSVFMILGEGTDAISNLSFDFLTWKFLLLFIDLPFFICAIRKKVKVKYTLNITGFLVIFFMSVCCFKLFIPAIKESISPLFYMPSDREVVCKYGTFVSDIFFFYFNSNEKNIIKNFKYGKKLEKPNIKEDKPNIIILQLESIDSNVVDQQYKGQYIAPYLHSLSQKCVYYPYTMSYHMGGGTSDAEFSILNSLEPSQFYPAMTRLGNYDYPNSFLKQLNKNDYTCLAFHGNVGNYFNRDNAFSVMGFSDFYDISSMHLKNKGWGASDSDVLDFVKDKLNSIDSPFLAYIITLTSHASFTNARNYYNNKNYDDIKDNLVKEYFNSVSYVDTTLKEFVSYVQKNIPNTYIFIWGDHTPAVRRKPLYSDAHMSFESRFFEFVPLFIITPDNVQHYEHSRVASFLDIAPTILEACGGEYSIYSDGNDLLDFKNDNFSSVPFKGGIFSREVLFSEISNIKN